MAWHVEVAFAGDKWERETVATEVASPYLGPAVESALHELGVSTERTGSFQITVTQPRDGRHA